MVFTNTVKLLRVLPLFLLSSHVLKAVNLEPETLRIWQRYIDQAQVRSESRPHAAGKFLWLDEDSRRLERVRKGDIEVAPMGQAGYQPIEGGWIQDWIGAILIPNASLELVLDILADYGRYKYVYHPEVADAKLLVHSGQTDEFSLRIVNKVLFVTTGINIRCLGRMVRVDERRAYSNLHTIRVEEIKNVGRPDERDLAPDTGDGFIWRLSSMARFEERDGGVYLEMETIALTRDIPRSLNFLVAPMVKKLSRNSLSLTLEKTREAVKPLEARSIAAPSGSGLATHAKSFSQTLR
jgi:hypothetical protein